MGHFLDQPVGEWLSNRQDLGNYPGVTWHFVSQRRWHTAALNTTGSAVKIEDQPLAASDNVASSKGGKSYELLQFTASCIGYICCILRSTKFARTFSTVYMDFLKMRKVYISTGSYNEGRLFEML